MQASGQSDAIGTTTRVFLPLVIAPQEENLEPNNGLSPLRVNFTLNTSVHSYPSSATAPEVVVFNQILTGTISGNAARWMQLHFSNHNLGEYSFLRLTALDDGNQQQLLDATSMGAWNNFSAFFNGNRVRIELVVRPGATGVFANLDFFSRNQVGTVVAAQVDTEHGTESLCGGADDRVTFADTRVARLGGICTAWLVSNGAVLTAGHCVDFDPDESGPLLPDGILDLVAGDVIEFNVPASDTNGDINWAAPANQYPIDVNRFNWNFDGNGEGLGKDWAVFAVHPNQSNQMSAHSQHGFFRMTNDSPNINNIIRITGYGVDRTPTGSTSDRNGDNQTLQTHTGAYRGESSGTGAAAGDIWHRHQVDTEGGNSGSPVIWQDTGFTIGIHTNGGCTNPAAENYGTSFEVNVLEDAIDDFPGNDVIYVDAGGRDNPGDGSIFHPFRTLTTAIGPATPDNATVSIVAGSYAQPLEITQRVTLVAPVGAVTIGQ